MPALPSDTERLHFAWWRESDLGDALSLWGDPEVTAPRHASLFLERRWPSDCAPRSTTRPASACSTGASSTATTAASSAAAACAPTPGSPKAPGRSASTCAARVGDRATPAKQATLSATSPFETLRTRELYAGHHPDNHASRRLLEKFGFAKIDKQLYPPTGLVHPWYRLER